MRVLFLVTRKFQHIFYIATRYLLRHSVTHDRADSAVKLRAIVGRGAMNCASKIRLKCAT